MFISKLSLARRTFLRSAGAVVALPFLEAMVPALTQTVKTAANPKRRFGAVYVPNGVIIEQWTPETVGKGFQFMPILKPLEPFKDQVVVVSNLRRAGGELTASHAPTAAAWLSSTIAKRTEGEDVRLGTTIDQIIAKENGQETPFPSLEVATENFVGYLGACSTGYSCAYMNTLAWSSPTSPLPSEVNPRVVFERMFGRAGTNDQRAARLRRSRSILDSVTADVGDLERRLGSRDRVRLSEYLDNIREIERRIQRTEAQNLTQVTVPDAPVGVPDTFEDHVALMFDLLKVAYQSDLTRVFTFMLGREASNRTYLNLGIVEGHHEVSHHGHKPETMAKHLRLNIYHAEQFAKFIEGLRATPDGDGTLLDHSLIVYGSGMSDGNVHSAGPLPLVAVGGSGGKGHRHLRLAENTPIGNLWLGIAQQFGSTMETFGESTGSVTL